MTQFLFKNVYFSYHNKPKEEDWVLKDINLEIKEGEFVIILGHNGCGKTTLLKHFNGLLKPQRGEVYFYNKRIQDYKDIEIFSKVGFLFQDPNDQLFGITVEQDVSFGPLNMGLSESEIEERINKSLELVGMLEFRKMKISELSFGQKQRVAIAGVIANEPSVIVFDEPTSALDPATQIEIMNLLKNLNQKGLTIIMTTHDIEYIAEYSNRIIVMLKGKITYDDTPDKIFKEKSIISQSNLRLPLISILAKKICEKYNIECDRLPLTIEEALDFLDKLLLSKQNKPTL
ncbi:MAG: ATP-binding cassette domain-containing protein [Brevinematales bacterium]|nr:ATP-binding cassette domain-containing protein [Brevinematales bacterium]